MDGSACNWIQLYLQNFSIAHHTATHKAVPVCLRRPRFSPRSLHYLTFNKSLLILQAKHSQWGCPPSHGHHSCDLGFLFQNLILSSQSLSIFSLCHFQLNTVNKSLQVFSQCENPSVDKVCCCLSVTKLCPTLCDPMDYSMPGFLILHSLPEFAQTHVHWVSDAIQPSHLLPPPSPFAFNLSQYQVFSNESALHIRWPRY